METQRGATARARWYRDDEKTSEYVAGELKRSTFIPWMAKFLGGFLTRTGGDLIVPYGQYTDYDNPKHKFNQELAVRIFTEKATWGQGTVP